MGLSSGLPARALLWGSVFLINVPVVIVTLGLTFANIPALAGNPDRHWDAPTSAVLTVSLVALLYALKGVLKADIHSDEVAAAFVCGVTFFWWFIRRQRVLSSPLIDFTLFRNAGFSIGAVGALFSSFVMIGIQYVLSQKLQLVDAFTPLQAGLYVLPIAAGSLIAGPTLGAVLFRVGIARMLALTLGLAALGLTLFALATSATPLLWQVATLIPASTIEPDPVPIFAIKTQSMRRWLVRSLSVINDRSLTARSCRSRSAICALSSSALAR